MVMWMLSVFAARGLVTTPRSTLTTNHGVRRLAASVGWMRPLACIHTPRADSNGGTFLECTPTALRDRPTKDQSGRSRGSPRMDRGVDRVDTTALLHSIGTNYEFSL